MAHRAYSLTVESGLDPDTDTDSPTLEPDSDPDAWRFLYNSRASCFCSLLELKQFFFLCSHKILWIEVNKQNAVWFTGRLSFQRCDNLMHFEVYCDELFRFCGIILITGCVTEVCSDVFTGKRD